MADILKDLHYNASGIDASAVFSKDGLILASELPKDMEEYKIAALSAAILSLSERASFELTKGTLEQVLVKGINGNILFVGAGEDVVLTALTKKNAKLDHIYPDIRKTAKKIAEVI